MKSAVSVVRKRLLILLLLVAAFGVAVVAYAEVRRGPHFCGSCQLRNPMPDRLTRDAIEKNRALIDRMTAPFGPTYVYVICNASACVDYRQNNSGGWEGSNARRVQNGTGGGGGGAGPNRGGGGGGGCVASCGTGPGSAGSGSVYVGDDERLPPNQQR